MISRNRLSLLLAATAALFIAACSEDDGVGPIPPGAADITGDITANRTLYAETTYTLKGFVHVANGATLTIQPGTTILGDFATPGSSLFILRGARINAVGTADAPIVFTSSRPDGQRAPGDWGGLIIIGNAPINRVVSGGIEVEGTGTVAGTTPGTNYRVTYDGGTAVNDNSGELRYVRVEYAGFAPALDNELNAFTFAAVGNGTRLSYLQVLAGLDDSFEWFGGTVDAHHLVSYESGDDHFDMSEGYAGRLQHLIALQSARLTPTQGGNLSGDPQGIENDGCDASKAGCTAGFNSTPLNIPLVSNFTLVGTGELATSGTSGGIGMLIRRGTGGYYLNGIIARWPRAGVSMRDADTYARAGSTQSPDVATTDLAVRNVAFVETATMFESGSGRNSFDAAANSLTSSQATTTATFTAFPATIDDNTTAAAFDWTPAAGSTPASGGLATLPSGKIATKASAASSTGHTFTGTAYLGAAAPGGPKWWQGWTKYDRR